MELGEPDESGRRWPVLVEGSEYEMPCDLVIVALGTVPNPLLTSATPELSLSKWKNIVRRRSAGDQHGKACSPAATSCAASATVILAMGDGKKAARAIDEYLKQKKEAAARSAPLALGR